MKLAIVKYNAGNIQSVSFALDRLGVNYVITDNADEIRSCDKVIFPGVGEASTTMNHLASKNLDTVIKHLKQPTLGICLGMQLLCKHTGEKSTVCLGVIDTEVLKFDSTAETRVPHMGWNRMSNVGGWLPGSLGDSYVYFAHSYYVPVNQYTVATTTHGISFSAAIRKDNFFGVQFHPEKSADTGQQVLNSFLSL